MTYFQLENRIGLHFAKGGVWKGESFQKLKGRATSRHVLTEKNNKKQIKTEIALEGTCLFL